MTTPTPPDLTDERLAELASATWDRRRQFYPTLNEFRAMASELRRLRKACDTPPDIAALVAKFDAATHDFMQTPAAVCLARDMRDALTRLSDDLAREREANRIIGPDAALLIRVKACLPMDSAEDENGFQRDVRALVTWALAVVTGEQPS